MADGDTNQKEATRIRGGGVKEEGGEGSEVGGWREWRMETPIRRRQQGAGVGVGRRRGGGGSGGGGGGRGRMTGGERTPLPNTLGPPPVAATHLRKGGAFEAKNAANLKGCQKLRNGQRGGLKISPRSHPVAVKGGGGGVTVYSSREGHREGLG